MTKPLISVIVPVYKVEAYLARCIESILNQTYENIELILVDDGSPDRCPEICDQYARRDPRIVMIHKKNGGVSSARNAGLNVMRGAHVCFVDSDDWLPQDAVMNLYECAVQDHSSYVVGICGINGLQNVKNPIQKAHTIVVRENPEELLSYIVGSGSYSPYAKLYDAEIIREHNLRFREDMRIAEDAVFLRTYLTYCSSVSLIPHIVYEYNNDNIHSLSKKAYEEYCQLYNEKMKAVSLLVNGLPISQKRRDMFLAERGINGIHISVNHYFEHWSGKADLLSFLKEISTYLLPWVKEEVDSVMVENNSWWKHHYRAFRQGDFEKLYVRIAIEKRIQSIRKFVGVQVRRLVRRNISRN